MHAAMSSACLVSIVVVVSSVWPASRQQPTNAMVTFRDDVPVGTSLVPTGHVFIDALVIVAGGAVGAGVAVLVVTAVAGTRFRHLVSRCLIWPCVLPDGQGRHSACAFNTKCTSRGKHDRGHMGSLLMWCRARGVNHGQPVD